MLTRIAQIIKEALLPSRCLVCGSFFQIKDRTSEKKITLPAPKDGVFQTLMMSYLCPECLSDYRPVASPICLHCGIQFKSREGEDHICGACLSFPKNFRKARAAGIYDRALLEVIHCFKYKGKIQLARPLGKLLFNAFIRHFDVHRVERIVPVPLHPKRLKKRGFNQAFLLIKDWGALAEAGGIDMSGLRIDRLAIERNRWTEPQIGLSRKKRLSNIKHAFRLCEPSGVSGKRILLVDDVYTTGATVDECAKILLKGDAKQVDVLTLARTV